MKKVFFYLCMCLSCLCFPALLCSCNAKDEDAVTKGKVMVDGAMASKPEILDLIEQGEHIDIKWGKEFETNRGDFRYVYINGHRFIMWVLLSQDVNSTGSIFEDGDCPKCKAERQEYVRQILDGVKDIHRHF